MKNKKSIIMIILCVALITALIIINPFETPLSQTDTNIVSFKEKYESLNDTKRTTDLQYPDAQYKNITIDETSDIKILRFSELREKLEKWTGVIYFWAPWCPRCRSLIVELLAVSKEKNTPIYVYDPSPIRNSLSLENWVIVEEKKTGPEYAYLLEKLNYILPQYKWFEDIDASIKRLYMPFVVFVKDWIVVDYHRWTVESHTDKYQHLNWEQKAELAKLLWAGIDSISQQEQNYSCITEQEC